LVGRAPRDPLPPPQRSEEAARSTSVQWAPANVTLVIPRIAGACPPRRSSAP